MLKILAAATAALALATPASAAVVLATFQGFATGTAAQGLFGDDTAFADADFRAVLTIDDGLGALSETTVNAILQGSGAAAPVTAAYIEIAGVRRDLAPASAFLLAQKLSPRLIYTVGEAGAAGASNLVLRSLLGGPLPGFAAPASSTLGGTGGAFTSFGADNQVLASFQLRTTSFEAAAPPPPAAGVPEPGAWMLMLLGLGGAGALVRGRRRRAAA